MVECHFLKLLLIDNKLWVEDRRVIAVLDFSQSIRDNENKDLVRARSNIRPAALAIGRRRRLDEIST